MASENVAPNNGGARPSRRKNKKNTSSSDNSALQTNSHDTQSTGGGVGEESDIYETQHMKELQKNIRNINKKLSGMSKVDSIIKENPNLSLDDLVATRKINQDQKAQALKKPALQSSITQLEEQVAAYKKVEEDLKQRFQVEKQHLLESHEKELEEAKSAAKAEASGNSRNDIRQKLLVLSRFLRAAAARRQADDEDSDDSKAFEGVLLLLYGGDITAVDAAERLINGTEDMAPSTEGASLEVAYQRIKQLSLEYAPFAAEEAWVNGVAQAEQQGEPNADKDTSKPVETDPTVANAGLTEVEDSTLQPATEEPVEAPADLPEQTGIDTGAGNAAAEQWNSKPLEEPDQSWNAAPRNPQETRAMFNRQPHTATESWADDAATEAQDKTAQANSSDGFHEVHHGRGGRHRGGSAGDFRGGGRGRGAFRGDGGRGRGGFRVDRARGRGSRGGRGRDGTQ